MPTGHCHCGAIRYEVTGDPVYKALCHCDDCRRHAGAPVVGWAAFPGNALTVQSGTAKVYASSENGRRHFCPDCGTGLFYYNETVLPGLVDIQIATLDDPGAMAPDIHVQAAERLGWMAKAHELPAFDRYPAPE
ncbi:MAG: GFA family protein [Sphingomonas sp.]|nr:GFA family protein [Sphingomonas sp.]